MRGAHELSQPGRAASRQLPICQPWPHLSLAAPPGCSAGGVPSALSPPSVDSAGTPGPLQRPDSTGLMSGALGSQATCVCLRNTEGPSAPAPPGSASVLPWNGVPQPHACSGPRTGVQLAALAMQPLSDPNTQHLHAAADRRPAQACPEKPAQEAGAGAALRKAHPLGLCTRKPLLRGISFWGTPACGAAGCCAGLCTHDRLCACQRHLGPPSSSGLATAQAGHVPCVCSCRGAMLAWLAAGVPQGRASRSKRAHQGAPEVAYLGLVVVNLLTLCPLHAAHNGKEDDDCVQGRRLRAGQQARCSGGQRYRAHLPQRPPLRRCRSQAASHAAQPTAPGVSVWGQHGWPDLQQQWPSAPPSACNLRQSSVGEKAPPLQSGGRGDPPRCQSGRGCCTGKAGVGQPTGTEGGWTARAGCLRALGPAAACAQPQTCRQQGGRACGGRRLPVKGCRWRWHACSSRTCGSGLRRTPEVVGAQGWAGASSTGSGQTSDRQARSAGRGSLQLRARRPLHQV